MKFQNILFPAAFIIVVAMLAPIVFGQAAAATYWIVGVCAALIIGFVIVAAFNSYRDGNKTE